MTDRPDVPDAYAADVAAMSDTNNGTPIERTGLYRARQRANARIDFTIRARAVVKTRPAIALAAALAMSACAGDPNDPTASFGGRQLLSTGIGAGAGGLIGSRFGTGSSKLALTGLGTLAGGAAGLWLSQPPHPSSIPVPPVPPQSQPVCREVASSGLIAGRAEQVNSVACLGPDGIWRRAAP